MHYTVRGRGRPLVPSIGLGREAGFYPLACKRLDRFTIMSGTTPPIFEPIGFGPKHRLWAIRCRLRCGILDITTSLGLGLTKSETHPNEGDTPWRLHLQSGTLVLTGGPGHPQPAMQTSLSTLWWGSRDPNRRRGRHSPGSGEVKGTACGGTHVRRRVVHLHLQLHLTHVLNSPWPAWWVHLLSSCPHAPPHVSKIPNFQDYLHA